MKKKKHTWAYIIATFDIILILLTLFSFILVFLSSTSLPSSTIVGGYSLYMNEESVLSENGEYTSLMLNKKQDSYSKGDTIIFATKHNGDIAFQQSEIQSIYNEKFIVNDLLEDESVKVSSNEVVSKVVFDGEYLGAFVSLCHANLNTFYLIAQACVILVILSSGVMIIVLNAKKHRHAPKKSKKEENNTIINGNENLNSLFDETTDNNADEKPADDNQTKQEDNVTENSSENLVSEKVDELPAYIKTFKENETIEFSPTIDTSQVPPGVEVSKETITSIPYQLSDNESFLSSVTENTDTENVKEFNPKNETESTKDLIDQIDDINKNVEYNSVSNMLDHIEEEKNIEQKIVNIEEQVDILKPAEEQPQIDENEDSEPVEELSFVIEEDPEPIEEPKQEPLRLSKDELTAFINDILNDDNKASQSADNSMSDDELESFKKEILELV